MDSIITISKYTENIAIVNMSDIVNKNTFTDCFVETLIKTIEIIKNDKSLKVVIFRGLQDIFCAGAAKEALMGLKSGDISVKDLVLSEMMLDIPVPTIALMEGGALGGGLVLGLCCDMVILNERAMYGTNFTNLGFTPGMGCTRLLQGLVGDYIANEMMFTGKLYKGRKLKEAGLSNYVLPYDEQYEKAIGIAKIIAEKPHKTLEILKYSLSLKKKHLLMEARVHEDFMHKISFAQKEVLDIVNERYAEVGKNCK